MKWTRSLVGVVGLVVALAALSAAEKVDHSGHMVIRVIPETKEQLEFLRDWQNSGLDFWHLPSSLHHPADIHVTPHSYYYVARTLAEHKLDHKIFIADLGELERQEEQQIALRRAIFSGNGKAIDLENYHTYEDIMAHLRELEASSNLVSSKVAGTTLEGREIVQVTISSDPTANKRVVFFDCNIHAREWITAATCLWIIDQLTSGYGSDPEITQLVDDFDWKFVPVTNPDGYSHTWGNDRLWRKNRNPNSGGCLGVDVNRNFPVGFAGSGSSNSPCSDTYHGDAAFSEKEAQALRDLIAEDRGRVVAAISVHSYSQLWLSPYSYKVARPSDYDEMFRVMTIAVGALEATYGTQYTFGNSAQTLYVASGVTADHYYDNEGVIHSYVIELRDTGRYGFLLPANQIVPTATETWNGLKAMVRAL